jgi:hypothetical protein
VDRLSGRSCSITSRMNAVDIPRLSVFVKLEVLPPQMARVQAFTRGRKSRKRSQNAPNEPSAETTAAIRSLLPAFPRRPYSGSGSRTKEGSSTGWTGWRDEKVVGDLVARLLLAVRLRSSGWASWARSSC